MTVTVSSGGLGPDPADRPPSLALSGRECLHDAENLVTLRTG